MPLVQSHLISRKMLTDTKATISLCVPRTRLLHLVPTNRKDDDEQLKTVKHGNKSTYDRNICNAPQTFYSEQSMYIDHPLMRIYAAQSLATDSYSKLLLSKIGLFKIVEIWPRSVIIDENATSSTVWTDHLAVTPTLRAVQDIVHEGNNGNIDRFPNDAKGKNEVRQTHSESM